MLFGEVMPLHDNRCNLHQVSNKLQGLGALLQGQSSTATGENTAGKERKSFLGQERKDGNKRQISTMQYHVNWCWVSQKHIIM